MTSPQFVVYFLNDNNCNTLLVYQNNRMKCCKDNGLAINKGKTKYMEIGRHRGMITNVHIKIGSNSYEKVKTFTYLDSLLTNQNSIQQEIICRLKAGNSCYHSVQ